MTRTSVVNCGLWASAFEQILPPKQKERNEGRLRGDLGNLCPVGGVVGGFEPASHAPTVLGS